LQTTNPPHSKTENESLREFGEMPKRGRVNYKPHKTRGCWRYRHFEWLHIFDYLCM